MNSAKRNLLIVVCAVVCAAITFPVYARGRVARVSRSAPRQINVQRSLPANYGSIRQAVPQQIDRSDLPVRTQPIAESGSRTTYRGGEVEWKQTPAGRTAVKGETALGREFGGVQTIDGQRAVAAKTYGGDVAVRTRDGDQGVYRKVDDKWQEVNYVGVPYYYHDYHWYHPYYYGGHVYYHEVYAPAGAEVDALPDGARKVVIDGKEYILWDGVYYQEVNGKYKVVNLKGAVSDNDPLALLDRMNKFLSSQKTFFVETDEDLAEPLANGKFKDMRVQREVAVTQPDRIRVRKSKGDVAAQFWYDGKTASLYDATRGFYGQIAFQGALPNLLELLQRDYAVTLPLSDLFRPGLVDNLRGRVVEQKYKGLAKVDGRDCHHVVVKTADVEGQLFIDADGRTPYPRRVVLEYPKAPGKPAYKATLSKWQTGVNLAESVFKFSPPDGARRIAIMPTN